MNEVDMRENIENTNIIIRNHISGDVSLLCCYDIKYSVTKLIYFNLLSKIQPWIWVRDGLYKSKINKSVIISGLKNG